jgi:hypothetical protein
MKFLTSILITLIVLNAQKTLSQKYVFNERVEYLRYNTIGGKIEKKKISQKKGVFRIEIVYSNQARDTLFINTPDGAFITHYKYKSKELDKNKIYEYWNTFSYTLGNGILFYIALDKRNVIFMTNDKIVSYYKTM